MLFTFCPRSFTGTSSDMFGTRGRSKDSLSRFMRQNEQTGCNRPEISWNEQIGFRQRASRASFSLVCIGPGAARRIKLKRYRSKEEWDRVLLWEPETNRIVLFPRQDE